MPTFIDNNTLKLGNFYIVNPINSNNLEIRYNNSIVIARFEPDQNSTGQNQVFHFYPGAGNLNNSYLPTGTQFYAKNDNRTTLGINIDYNNGRGTGFVF